ncbi:MAG: aminotransferase class V-fold PLP-dependent enzyme [Chloroflexi bacterium]|nr:aminotransferase class V-fold PLP-dependent enzyme [Chloroflexota bacterium]
MTTSPYESFLKKYPSYSHTTRIDELRQKDYNRLEKTGQVYLDYTGGGLYAASQVMAHQESLLAGVFGNPHSSNPSSRASTELVEKARESVLKFFNADPDEYVVIFTSNASGALKLVGESYPFGEGCQYLLTFDNHNSVNGIREYALSKKASVTYIPVLPPRMRVEEPRLMEYLDSAKKTCNNLFAYPAQSNFSGVQHPLAWIEEAHQRGWDVLLDAAAFAPTNKLDLSLYHPDFVPVSFYKMFGYPTGVGALIARRSVISKLHRPWFAGGTITVASVQENKHFLADAPAAFEDGTLDYLNIPAVKIGLDHLETIGLEMIHERVLCLVGWLLENLVEIKYPNGKPLVKIYGPVSIEQRGGSVAMNFVDDSGRVVDHRWIEERANQKAVSLRTGCFCNPGAGEMALGISSAELTSCFNRPDHEQRLTYDEFRLCIDGKASGAVRVSVGLVSNFSDVEAFLDFARQLTRSQRKE